MAFGVDLQSCNLSLAVIPIKMSHLSNSAGEQGVTGKSIGRMAVWMMAWGCNRALEGFKFLFKVVSHASVLVLPAKVHGKLLTKIQERGAGGGELSFWSFKESKLH